MKNETIPVTLRLSKTILENLKRIARERSFKSNTDMQYTDLIRDMVTRFIVEDTEKESKKYELETN